MMRMEGVTGGKGAGTWVEAQDGTGKRLANHSEYFQGTRDWTPVAFEFTVPPLTYQFEVGFALDGRGKVWADDFRLEVLVDAEGKKPV